MRRHCWPPSTPLAGAEPTCIRGCYSDEQRGQYMKLRIVMAIALAAVAVLLSPPPSDAAERKPNVVFILVDNVGWGDLGVYGGVTPTPRIDKLANEGIRFNNYNVEAQCTPTRSAIMTGRMSVRSGTYKFPYPGEGNYGLAPWE